MSNLINFPETERLEEVSAPDSCPNPDIIAENSQRYKFDASEQRFIFEHFLSHQKNVLSALIRLGYPIYNYLNVVADRQDEGAGDEEFLTSSGRKRAKRVIGPAKRVSELKVEEALSHKMVLEVLRDLKAIDADSMDFALKTFLGYDYSLISKIIEFADGSEEPWFVSKEEGDYLVGQTDSWHKTGVEYVEVLVKGNMGLVQRATQKLRGDRFGVTDEEIKAAGVDGLTRAIYRWTNETNCAFSTMAYNWIQAIAQRMIQTHSRDIRIPSHVYERYFSIQKAIKSLGGEFALDKPDSMEALSETTGLTPETIIWTLDNFRNGTTSIHQRISQNFEDSMTMEDVIPDNGRQAGDDLIHKELQSKLHEILNEVSGESKLNYAAVALTYELENVEKVCLGLVRNLKENLSGSLSRIQDSGNVQFSERSVKMV